MDSQSIATNAQNIKKPSKKDCFYIIKDLINKGMDIDENILEHNLSGLYAFFLPPTPAKPKTDQQWVSKAVPKKDIRHYLNYLYSDGSRLIGTDGHRLHVMHGTDLGKGFYNTELVKLDVDATYPDIDRIIPIKGVTTIMHLSDFDQLETYTPECDNPTISVKLNDSHFNKSYILAAISRFDDSPIEALQLDSNSAIRLQQKDLQAVIMPMRV